MKFINLIALVVLISTAGFAQVDTTIVTRPANSSLENELSATETTPEKTESKFDKSKMYFGGFANLTFGSYTVIGLEPLVGYKLTPKFSLGGKLGYEYIKDNRYSPSYESSNYGFSLFSRYRIVPQLYAHVEYSGRSYKFNFDDSRTWVPFLFVGGGYSQPITRNTWMNAQVLFDVLQNENSPYKNWEPYWSVGVGVGF